jgi:hypothetical protein
MKKHHGSLDKFNLIFGIVLKSLMIMFFIGNTVIEFQ